MSEWFVRFPLSDRPDTTILTEEVRKKTRIGIEHWEASLDEIPDDLPHKVAVKRYIRHMHDWYEPGGYGLVIHGSVGSGKTSLGSIILKNAIARGGYGFFMESSEMVELLLTSPTHRFRTEGPTLIEILSNVTFFLLDDLVIEEPLWRMKQVEKVVRARARERLPTIITTNVDKDALFVLAWFKSLCLERFYGIEVRDVNWRKAAWRR